MSGDCSETEVPSFNPLMLQPNLLYTGGLKASEWNWKRNDYPCQLPSSITEELILTTMNTQTVIWKNRRRIEGCFTRLKLWQSLFYMQLKTQQEICTSGRRQKHLN